MKLCNAWILLFLGFCATNLFAVGNSEWGFCRESDHLGFSDAKFTKRKPTVDAVCNLKTAHASANDRTTNESRCLNSQVKDCQVDAGGDAKLLFGDKNVPRDAWYVVAGLGSTPHVRCRCGCFPGSVEILTNHGYLAIGNAARNATPMGGLVLATVDAESDNFRASAPVFNPDFTVGPEEKEVLHLRTESGFGITVTDQHPIVTLTEVGSERMVRAIEIRVGSILVLEDGTPSPVVEITTGNLQPDDNLVYNVDTKGASASEHIIFANRIRVGDVVWQRRLSELSSRVDNIMHAARS